MGREYATTKVWVAGLTARLVHEVALAVDEPPAEGAVPDTLAVQFSYLGYYVAIDVTITKEEEEDDRDEASRGTDGLLRG